MAFDIVLVDDHKLVRDGVRTILERGAEFRVVGEAENGGDAVQLCKKAQPDLVVIGNALSRGNPEVEYVLDSGLRYASMAETVLVSLPTPDTVKFVALAHAGVIAGKTVKTFIDLSTTGPRVASEVAEALGRQELFINRALTAHALHHSLVSDLHRDAYGPVGLPECLHFLEADGSLRAGHEAFNEFAPAVAAARW